MNEKIERFKEIQDYYWIVMEPQVNGVNDPKVQQMLIEKFGEEIPVNILSDILYSNFDHSVEQLIGYLETGGVYSREYTALKVLLGKDTPEVFYCRGCSKYYSVSKVEQLEYDGDIYCEDCRDRNFVECFECGKYIHQDDTIYSADGNYYCRECADSYLYECPECGDYNTESGIVRDNNGSYMCSSCFEHYYYICSNCGEFIHTDYARRVGGNIYCEDCYEDYCIIHEWDYKPSPQFHGDNERYLGVELEVDRGGEDDDNAYLILEILGDYAYCKHDGSLNNGFEIVSHPATLDYHMNEIDWDGAIDKLKYLGYVSHDAGTCGIHVHMNRKGFGDTEDEQDLGIAKILYFFERHWDKIVTFSRRTPSQLDDWAARYLPDVENHDPFEVLDYAKDDMSRYRCVNLCNYSTVELRVFRGSLVYETFMATLQFANLMYDIAELPLEDVMNLTWNDFKEMGSKYEEFTSYMDRRGL